MTEFPNDWIWTTIGEVCDKPKYGWTTSASDSGEVRLLRTTDLTHGPITWETVPFCKETPKTVADFEVHPNDIFISRAGSVGVSVLVKDAPFKSVFASYLIRVRPTKIINAKYLSFFLQSPHYWNQVLELSSGIALANINATKIQSMTLPLPPIGEQHKIVELLEDHLSRLDAALADVKQAKIKASQFRRSLLKSTFEEFGEHSVRIGDVVTFNRRRPAEFKNSNSEVSFVPMPKVSEVSGQIVLDERISHSEGQRRSLTYFENGDVIFAKITPCMENGKIALAKNLFEGAAYGSTEFHVLTPTERILPDYLRYFIGSDDFRANAERAMTGAVGQRRVPKTYLDDHTIPLPSLDIQTEIVAHLDESLSRTDDAIKVAEKIETESARLRRALLQSAFTGQLTKEVVSV
jgi:type I restriction enzyme S subunit